MNADKFDQHILLLQGGGALGAYQAGVYEGLAEIGKAPNWIVGISIGAINSALIAGNLPERRVERLRTFWERVSSYAPVGLPSWLVPLRSVFNQLSAATVATFGVPGFFTPRLPPPFFALEGSPGALSFYTTEPLRHTLEELVDFDQINHQEMHLSLGAVNVRTGASVYFDNQRDRIGPEHVLASGALPPGFPPKELGISEEEVIKTIMLKETVDGEFTTVEDVAEVALFFAAFPTNALTGQSLIVSHGWFME